MLYCRIISLRGCLSSISNPLLIHQLHISTLFSNKPKLLIIAVFLSLCNVPQRLSLFLFFNLVPVENGLQLLLLRLCVLSSLLFNNFSMGKRKVTYISVNSLICFLLVSVFPLRVQICVQWSKITLIGFMLIPFSHLVGHEMHVLSCDVTALGKNLIYFVIDFGVL